MNPTLKDLPYSKLADKHGFPLYLYDEGIIASQLVILRSVFEDFSILYSLKTNPHPAICRFMADSGLGADAASVYEVEKALAAGFTPHRIFYSAPGKTMHELAGALGKCVITADSYHELQRLDDLAGKTGATESRPMPVGLRINPSLSFGLGEFPEVGAGLSTKFGVDEESLTAHKQFFVSLKHIRIAGIHVFLRSQVLSHTALSASFEAIFKLAAFCRHSFGWELAFINFGGGLGIIPSDEVAGLDTEALRNSVNRLVTSYAPLFPGCDLLLESGRFLVGKAGTFITRIEDIKESRGTTYVIAPGGLGGFLRPSVMGLLDAVGSSAQGPFEPLYSNSSAHRISLPQKTAGPMIKVTVCGNLCTALDVVGKDVLMPEPEIGDILAVSNAGAYAATLSPFAFASFPRPAEIYRTRDNNFVSG